MRRLLIGTALALVFPAGAWAGEFTSKPYAGAVVGAEVLSWTFRSTSPFGSVYSGVAYELSSEDIWHGCLDSPHEVILDKPANGTYTITIADDYTGSWLVSEGRALEASRLCSESPAGGGFASDTVTVKREEGPSSPPNTPAPYDPGGPPWIVSHDQWAAEQQTAEYEAERKAREERERPPAAPAQGGGTTPPAAKPCVVPSLMGHSLKGARRLLAAAHCGLGHVQAPHRRHGALVITRQSPGRGRQLESGAAVAVTLGPTKHRR
jgi:hypothetical protein